MRRKYKYLICRFLTTVLAVVVLASCESETPQVRDFSDDLRYFPLDSGRWRNYDVEERIYFLDAPTAAFSYQIREEVGRNFTSEGGEPSAELLRYRRADESQNWQLDSIWVIRRTPRQAVTIKNNTPFVSLRFPLRDGLSWDGNLLNTKRRDDYALTQVGQTAEVGERIFPNALRVIQSMDSSLVDRDIRYEIYAQDTGLVHLYYQELTYCADPNLPCFGQFVIEGGREITYTLFDTGK